MRTIEVIHSYAQGVAVIRFKDLDKSGDRWSYGIALNGRISQKANDDPVGWTQKEALASANLLLVKMAFGTEKEEIAAKYVVRVNCPHGDGGCERK